MIVLSERYLRVVLAEYVGYFNRLRPHQGLHHATPVKGAISQDRGDVVSRPVLGGLHHDYQRAA